MTEHLLCWSQRTLGHCQDNEKLPWITSNVTEIDLESVEPAGSWVGVAVIASLLRDMAMSSWSLQFSNGYVNEAYDNWKIWKLASEMPACQAEWDFAVLWILYFCNILLISYFVHSLYNLLFLYICNTFIDSVTFHTFITLSWNISYFCIL